MTAASALYAGRLLAPWGRPVSESLDFDPVEDWARSGAMSLTGHAHGPPLVVTGPAVCLRGALVALQALAPDAELPGVGLLAERAAYAGHRRRGDVSCGGGSRLLSTRDGTVAVTLAREADVELVPALVETNVEDPWEAVQSWLATRSSAQAAERLSLLGLPYGIAGEATADLPWVVTEGAVGRPTQGRPVVVNLGALWAGPLAGALLRDLGCRVLKVEDRRRPDGARRGPPGFYELLNHGVEEVQLDLSTPAGRTCLEALVCTADVVIEGSRRRALAQLGLAAEDVVAASDRVTWVSITGHDRDSDRVGFGDDAAVAGGLLRDGCFVGDAIADPLAGVHAALVAWVGVLQGGSRLVDMALSRVAATARSLDTSDPRRAYELGGRWTVDGASGPVAVAGPAIR